MISTRDLSGLPDIATLRRAMQAMALLDAILCPEWQDRYYSFNASWAVDEQLGSMRNGSGDDLFVHFGPAGCWIKGFAHEHPLSSWRDDGSVRAWPGVLDAVPGEFADCLREPAFAIESVTFCVWRRTNDEGWRVGPVDFSIVHADPDGSAFLLSRLDGRPESYGEYAANYFGRAVDLDAVGSIYAHEPLTAEVVARLNSEVSLADLAPDIREIGYPSGHGPCRHDGLIG